MRLGIMQPYFFPYLGYYDLVRGVDEWVVFDTVQYIRHGWVNRNRILHPTEGWQYVLVPLQKHSRETRICDVRIVEDPAWRARVGRQMDHYRRRAPHFEAVRTLVEDCLATPELSLSRLNVRILQRTCELLGIRFRPRFFSEMDLRLGPVEGPGDWALRISEALGAAEYVNPAGGKDLFDPAAFAARGIRLEIQAPLEFAYECPGYRFEPSLSILDVLMWNPPGRVREFLDGRAGRRA